MSQLEETIAMANVSRALTLEVSLSLERLEDGETPKLENSESQKLIAISLKGFG